MISRTIRRTAFSLALVAMLLAPPVFGSVDASKPERGASEEVGLALEESPAEQAVEESEQAVQDEIAKALAARRAAMLSEAHAALDETNAAVAALDEGKTDEALEALARATGKLTLIVARDPDLALAPVDVRFIKHDLHASPATIRQIREDAEALLAEGKVQEARTLLSGMASEINVRVSNLPLATYPEAIKAISPMIDAGKIDEARRALHAALNTLIVTNQVIPLPMLRAKQALEAARMRMEEGAESGEDGMAADSADRLEEAEALLADTRAHLERARLLGYGEPEEHERLRSDLAKLETRIGAGGETDGLFASLRKSLDEWRTSLFDAPE